MHSNVNSNYLKEVGLGGICISTFAGGRSLLSKSSVVSLSCICVSEHKVATVTFCSLIFLDLIVCYKHFSLYQVMFHFL